MINKIFFTKTIRSTNSQLEFHSPSGYKVYNPLPLYLKSQVITKVDLGVKIYSENPITILYSEIIPSSFIISNKVCVILPKTSTSLFLYLYTEKEVKIKENTLVGHAVVLQTSFIDLFEVNNTTFENYA